MIEPNLLLITYSFMVFACNWVAKIALLGDFAA
jgi:hypothetical protein